MSMTANTGRSTQVLANRMVPFRHLFSGSRSRRLFPDAVAGRELPPDRDRHPITGPEPFQNLNPALLLLAGFYLALLDLVSVYEEDLVHAVAVVESLRR